MKKFIKNLCWLYNVIFIGFDRQRFELYWDIDVEAPKRRREEIREWMQEEIEEERKLQEKMIEIKSLLLSSSFCSDKQKAKLKKDKRPI
jgi:hypothetical protein